MTTPAPERKLRICDDCGGHDDYPRHVMGVPPGTEGTVPTDEFIDALPDGISAHAMRELLDPTGLCRHIDCCAAMGCESCTDLLAQYGNPSRETLLAAMNA